MKTAKKLLAILLSALLLIPTLALPFSASAEESTGTVLAEFKYNQDKTTEVGTDVKSGSTISNGARFYLSETVDLTTYGASSDATPGAPITAPDIYLQADMQLDTNGNTVNLLFLQPHSASSLSNNNASKAEINAAANADGWYTVSVPLSQFSNNDGIDVSDIQWATYFIAASDSVDVQIKNFRIVKITVEEIRTALNAMLTGEQPTEDEYISIDAYNAAFAAAQTAYNSNAATGADLMTAWNVLRSAKDALEPVPEGINKVVLEKLLTEELPERNYHRDALKAYTDAKATGQIVFDDKAATQEAVDEAVKAITDAKDNLYDITHEIAILPSDADGNTTSQWTLAAGSTTQSLYPAALSKEVDLSGHNPEKLRFRMDIRVVNADSFTWNMFTSQPRNGGSPNNFENQWDNNVTLTKDGWYTHERDFSASIKKSEENGVDWSKIDRCNLYMTYAALEQDVILEIRNMRIVDTSIEADRAVLAELVKTNVGDEELYPAGLWQTYQEALTDAQDALESATECQDLWNAQDALQAALDELGNRGILMEAIKESLPKGKTYSKDSLKAYNDAKEAAQAILESDTATNDDVNKALQALKDAKAALVETTFLAATFPMREAAESVGANGTSSVSGGVYRYDGKAVHIDSPAGLAEGEVDLKNHDRTKLYMQFDIMFEEGSANQFQIFFIRPTNAGGSCILNHSATEAVNAVSGETGVWHTISTPLQSGVKLDEIKGMSFYMLGADLEDFFRIRVKDFRMVDLSNEPVLNTLFADNMMFQQNKPISVFGQAGEGQSVKVELFKDGVDEPVAAETVVSDATGNWKAELLKETGLKGSYDTYTLKVSGGSVTYTYRNILIGEVWVAGGQSNMEYRIQHDVSNTEILESVDEYIRIFYEPSLVYGNEADQPLTPDFSVRNSYWSASTNIEPLKGASSLAFNFSKVLREELDVPVGYLNVSLGGTVIEAWMSREAIEGNDTVKTYLQEHNRYFDDNNWPQNINRMSALYNQKIGALNGYNVAGTLWYQGESNLHSDDLEIYTEMLNLLHEDWSRVFGFEAGKMPFIFAHIAPHTYSVGGHSQATTLAYFWEVVSDAWANSPDTMAQIPVYDLPLTHYFTNLNGQPQSNGPIHPADKVPVGQRFAAAALNLVYGGDEATSAPVYKSMEIVGNKIRITFDMVGSGLKVKDGESTIHGFAIAGEDGIYVDAQAKIVGANVVEVWNDRVKDPKNVTYAFSSFNMAGNLQNAIGIAAAPFRTDRNTVEENLYLPKDWQFADGEVWIVTGHNDTTKWESLWQSDKATLAYDETIKAEGTASLKAEYEAGTFGIAPVNGKNSVINQYQNFKYLTVHMKNPDDRNKTMKLQFTYGNNTYAAVLADQENGATETRVTLEAGSDFTAYTFDLTKLIDGRNTLVTDAATISGVLKNAAKMEFLITDSENGTVYIDDIQFGMTEKVKEEEKPSYLLGDVDLNGVVNANDALLALQAATKKISLNDIQNSVADVDDTVGVSSADALLILQYATKKIDSFPKQ